jgi:hypothetical protein
VGPDGIITTVAGAGGGDGFSGDGGPAILAKFSSIEDVAVAPDGSFYIADKSNERVRLVSTDGIITTVAGTGDHDFDAGGGGNARCGAAGQAGWRWTRCSAYITDYNRVGECAPPCQDSRPVMSSSPQPMARRHMYSITAAAIPNGGRVHPGRALPFAYDPRPLGIGHGWRRKFDESRTGRKRHSHCSSLTVWPAHDIDGRANRYLATIKNPANEQTILATPSTAC